MTSAVTAREGPAHLHLGKEVDVRTASSRADVTRMLPKDSAADTFVDLDELDTLGMTGIRLLLDLRLRADGQDVRLHFINVHTQPRRRIASAGLTEYFGLERSPRSTTTHGTLGESVSPV